VWVRLLLLPCRHGNALPIHSAGICKCSGVTITAQPAAAQYFGQNKIQYRTFKFEVLKTEHFDIHFYPEEAQAAREAARMAERWYARLTRVLDHRAFTGKLEYGVVPAELFGFFDAGVAWNRGSQPRGIGSGTRPWARSFGAGTRVNALGYLILEFAAVRALDRPKDNWQFVFGVRPGF
jgi:hypothetical protein